MTTERSSAFLIRAFSVVLFLAVYTASSVSYAQQESFEEWLQSFRVDASNKGIHQATLNATLTGLRPNPRIIELDRRQPEFTQTFWRYLSRRVSEARIQRGRSLLKKHGAVLKQIEARYGVPGRFLVSFWGLESNFGDYTGKMPVVQSIATLAYNPRRRQFFTGELIAALRIIQRGDMPPTVQGSWAGAMGQTQFMPSTYLRYADDGDGDGRRDLWNSFADIFSSSSNFLAKVGWQREQTWGREVRLPDGFDFEHSGLKNKRLLSDWQALGIRRVDGRGLPKVDIKASLILPAGYKGPAFLVYRNFRTIMIWNRSIYYAVAVGHLADRIIGKGAFAAKPAPDDVPLSRAQVKTMQRRLMALGLDVGSVDGVVGSKTRQAIKAFQRLAKLPPDGYPTLGLIEALSKFKLN
ncbi:MAG: lytic murein transglycosylase [Rhodospirillaceae bacterium]